MKAILHLCAGLAAALAAGAATADEVNTGYFGDVAIEGYDTVAYFTDGKAVKGSEKYAYDWLGASWHFASAEHRDMFSKAPMNYAPQFGGYCSEGVAFEEQTVNIEPEVFKIVDGKLYLTAGAQFDDIEHNRFKAEENWPKIRAALVAP